MIEVRIESSEVPSTGRCYFCGQRIESPEVVQASVYEDGELTAITSERSGVPGEFSVMVKSPSGAPALADVPDMSPRKLRESSAVAA